MVGVYGVLADAVVLLHFGFLAFLAVGGFLACRRRWLIWPHLAAAAWGTAIVVWGLECPLTYLENRFRERAGQAPSGGFIDTYVTGVLYPARYLAEARALLAVVVLVSWLVFVGQLRWGHDRVRAH